MHKLHKLQDMDLHSAGLNKLYPLDIQHSQYTRVYIQYKGFQCILWCKYKMPRHAVQSIQHSDRREKDYMAVLSQLVLELLKKKLL